MKKKPTYAQLITIVKSLAKKGCICGNNKLVKKARAILAKKGKKK